MTGTPAEDWQSNCITRLFPLRGKNFDVVLDQLTFDYGEGLSGRLQLREAGGQGKPAYEINNLLIAPGDAFSMHVDDLNGELERWSRWLATQTLAKVRKLNEAKLRPFQPLAGAKLEAAYQDWKALHDPNPRKRIARQKQALEAVSGRFDAFAKHVKAVWGLPVPRTLIAVQALFEAGEEGSMAADVVRGSELRPAGVLDRLAAGGLDRKVQKGRDERGQGRYFRDPPEFLTFAHGGEDGLHFGLWYDLDDKLPSRIMVNYARDSSETWLAGETPIASFIDRFQSREALPGRGGFRRRFLLEILEWFRKAESKLHKSEAKLRSPTSAPAGILGGWGVRCDGAPSPCDSVSAADEALSNDPATVKRWMADAKKRLAAGDPRMALVLGRSMHWKGGPGWKRSGPLLEAAYEALGRHALLGITQAHYKYREAPSVETLVEETDS